MYILKRDGVTRKFDDRKVVTYPRERFLHHAILLPPSQDQAQELFAKVKNFETLEYSLWERQQTALIMAASFGELA
ncbi:hypothetical protein C0995_004337 [Termitomyces sp. Mi166|nr:hypothetical protein C0995_004337 [Termitomyces sp. Mi166\